MSQESMTEKVRVALQEYAEYWAWLEQANEEEKHAVEVVEEMIGSSVLQRVAEKLEEEFTAWMKL